MTLTTTIKNYIADLNQKGLLRTRRVSSSNVPGLIHFDSNDYLSLTQDTRIAKAYQEGYKSYPSGSGGSMFLNGYHENHRAVERAFADFLAVDDCVLFSSGYSANLAVAALLGQLKANCIIDKSVHASLYDGLTLAKVPYQRYLHQDMNDLAHRLTPCSKYSALITEGMFSMSGQIAPLSVISSLCNAHGTELLVDEAHSFGVLGTNGRGSVALHQLTQQEVPLRIVPLGKAFAAQGAVVAGKEEWISALLQAGRSLIYSTAVSPALSYGLLKTLDIVIDSDDRREALNGLVDQFRACISQSPLTWSNSTTAIQQLQLGCPHLALFYAQELRKKGFACSAIRAPTVSTKATGLRIILNAHHKSEQINQLFYQLNALYEHKSH